MNKVFFIILGFLFFLIPVKTFAAESWDWNWNDIPNKPVLTNAKKIEVGAKSILVYDFNTDTVLYQKNPKHVQAIASITKLMTAVVLLENYNKNDAVNVSYRAASVSGSVMHLSAG
ncbi:MAG: hypothetical protein WC860_09860, partial [Candidatus Margulisiibacteriota bacterium]